MYKILYTSLNNNSIIYNLQFGFGQQYCTSHAFINIIEHIRKYFDDGNISCRGFVELHKAFDTVNQQILLAKSNHDGIRGVSNDWFKPNRNHYVSINSSVHKYNSVLAVVNSGVTQGSVLRFLLFLLYINDLNQAIKFCQAFHFADDTNLLYLSN